jgi:hypothetical protein
MVLCVAGMAARGNGDADGAEALLRRALDTLSPAPENRGYLALSLGELRGILESRVGGKSLREAARLSEREAELLFGTEGPDSPQAIGALFRAAKLHERSGDADAALALHRRVLAARKRLLGPMAEKTRQSRAEIRRIEMQKGPDMD